MLFRSVAGVEGSNLIFNIVFFITIVSLVVQGTTISFVARILNLSKPLEKTGNDFGVELPEEIDSDLSDMTITKSMLEEADKTSPKQGMRIDYIWHWGDINIEESRILCNGKREPVVSDHYAVMIETGK